MARRADVARGTCEDVTRHARVPGRATRAHATHRGPTGGAYAWQGPLKSTQTLGWCHVA